MAVYVKEEAGPKVTFPVPYRDRDGMVEPLQR
jgi:hypothetical protein